MSRILVLAWLPDGLLPRLAARFPRFEWIDGRTPEALDEHLPTAEITYGLPPVLRLEEAERLRWVQLVSAGVPQDFCPVALARRLTVTNLAGLYGATIAEHAFGMLLMLTRQLHTAHRNQREARWDRTVAERLIDLHGKTLGIVGLGDIGRSIARLAHAFGMRVVGCRRTDAETPGIDRVYPLSELRAMLAESDAVAVAAPLTPHSQGLLGPAEFAAMKRGTIYVNVSRGAIAREQALEEALRTGHLGGAGLDVYATEPLPAAHPFWAMPEVIVSPHVSGETINLSARPAERFARNLANWSAGEPLEGMVDLVWGY